MIGIYAKSIISIRAVVKDLWFFWRYFSSVHNERYPMGRLDPFPNFEAAVTLAINASIP